MSTNNNIKRKTRSTTEIKRQKNKLAANQYRKRRKLYVNVLEQTVKELQTNTLIDKISILQNENIELRSQINDLRSLLVRHSIIY